MKLNPLTVGAFSAGAMISSSLTAGAALLGYEGFNYNTGAQVAPVAQDGTPLAGLAGGVGWNGAWTAHNNQSGSMTVTGPGLTYDGLPTEGLSVSPGGYIGARRSFSSSNLTSGVFYVSLLLQAPGNGTRTGIRLSANVGTALNPSFQAAFGIMDGVAAITQGWGADPKLAQTGTVAFGVAHLLVAKINLDSDTISLFLNPTIGAAEPATASAAYTWPTDRLTSIGSITASGLSGGNGATFYEIRVGTTFADVTAVPEPSTFGLLGLGAVLLARRRRR